MKVKFALFLMLFTCTGLLAMAQQTTTKTDSVTAQDAIDFIKATAQKFPNTTILDKGSYTAITDVKFMNGKLVVFINGHDAKNKETTYWVYIIDPAKVVIMKEMDKTHMVAEEKGSIIGRLVIMKSKDPFIFNHDVFDLLVNTYQEIDAKYSKNASDGPVANFAYLNFYDKLNPDFISGNYAERLTKAFNFLIKAYAPQSPAASKEKF